MKERLQELDALRGIAALLVVAFHYTMHRDFADHGWVLGVTGVDLFFIISGFVIFMSVQNNSSPREFMRRRFFRLYPVYWIVVSFTAVLIFFNFANIYDLEPLTASRYFANLTMFQKLFGITSIDGPYWTLLVEMQFYIIVILALWARKIKYLAGILLVLMSALLINELIIQPIDRDAFEQFFFNIDLWLPLLGRVPFFLAGILFYKIYKGEGNWRTILVIIICYITALLVFQSFGPARHFIHLPQYIFTTTVYFGVFVLFLRKKLSIIVNPTTLFFGRISYSLYLIHQFMGINLIIPYLEKEYGIHYRQGAIISLCAAIVLAYFVTKFIEEPSIRFYKKKRVSQALNA